MTKKKNRVILSICAIFVCICSLLCFVPMFKNDKIEVYADEVVNQNVEFVGSNLYIFLGTYPHSDGKVRDFMSRSYSFVIDTSTNSLSSFTIHNNYRGLILSQTYDSFTSSHFEARMNNGTQSDYYSTWVTFSNYTSGVVTFGVPISVRVYSVWASQTYINNYFIYSDVNGNTISFNANVYYTDTIAYDITEMLLTDRTYYFTENVKFTDNQYYNQGYSQGKQDGKNEGIAEGEAKGYQQGFAEGEDNGYIDGFQKGVESANDYTFMSLLSATIDAPVKYFQSLFNFELLGVNLQGFLTGLFTLCVVVTIFKLALGG